MAERTLEYMAVAGLVPALRNPKRHDVSGIKASMGRLGYLDPIVMDERTGRLIAGHGRVETLVALRQDGEQPPEGVSVGADGEWRVPVSRGWASANDAEAEAAVIALNRYVELGGWDQENLAEMLQALAESDGGLIGVGYSESDLASLLAALEGRPEHDVRPPTPSLADRFLVPPFSVLDARQGYWQERKDQWLALGIRSEEGRPGNLLKMSQPMLDAHAGRDPYAREGRNRSTLASDSGNDPRFYYKKRLAEQRLGREMTTQEFLAEHYQGSEAYVGGTSIFDPVLCEVAYRWFCPPAGRVLDPFAGGSVRGVVAAALGLSYEGVDLRPEQCEANEEQLSVLALPGDASWHVGNSLEFLPEGPFDLVFTCPPYFDLERYSEDPADLSNAESYDEFLSQLEEVMTAACRRLADNRFACVVMGEVRDITNGINRGLVADTIRLMERAGCRFYNDAVLITRSGSLALRAARIFSGGRKLGKTHQNVLVFVKGDPRVAADACGDVEVVDVAAMFGEVVEEEAVEEGPTDQPEAPASPSWAMGRPLERLQALTALWAAHDGGLAQGAFARVREASLAAWAEKGELRAWGAGGKPVAALVSHRARASRAVVDFRGAEVGRVEPNDLVVTRMCCAPGYAGVVCSWLASEQSRVWVEAWLENPVERGIVDALALSWLGTKIRASSEMIGVYASGLAPHEMAGVDRLGLWCLDLAYDAGDAAEEVAVAALEWAQHYAVYNLRGSWSALALRSYGGHPDFIIKPAEMSKRWQSDHPEEMGWALADTVLWDRLPACRRAVEAIPGHKHRVRLMRLAPGDGELSRHADTTDPDAGTRPGQLMRLHLPLRTNPEVRFSSWEPTGGGRQETHMGVGSCWYLDTRKPHTAINGGPSERIHLVVDVECSVDLLGLGRDPAPLVEAVVPEAVIGPREAERWPL